MKVGIIDESDRCPAPESDDERRRYYCITDLGKRVFTAETERLSALLTVAETRIREAKA